MRIVRESKITLKRVQNLDTHLNSWNGYSLALLLQQQSGCGRRWRFLMSSLDVSSRPLPGYSEDQRVHSEKTQFLEDKTAGISNTRGEF